LVLVARLNLATRLATMALIAFFQQLHLLVVVVAANCNLFQAMPAVLVVVQGKALQAAALEQQIKDIMEVVILADIQVQAAAAQAL
jgi:hypothetical protein